VRDWFRSNSRERMARLCFHAAFACGAWRRST
jgi:hypothetical protein